MKKSRFTEAQIMGMLRQAEAGLAVPELCREHGISSATFYKWRAKAVCRPACRHRGGRAEYDCGIGGGAGQRMADQGVDAGTGALGGGKHDGASGSAVRRSGERGLC